MIKSYISSVIDEPFYSLYNIYFPLKVVSWKSVASLSFDCLQYNFTQVEMLLLNRGC